jgi:hypothetical protein
VTAAEASTGQSEKRRAIAVESANESPPTVENGSRQGRRPPWTLSNEPWTPVDRVCEVAWAHVEAREPDRNIEALRPEVDFRLFAASLVLLARVGEVLRWVGAVRPQWIFCVRQQLSNVC